MSSTSNIGIIHDGILIEMTGDYTIHTRELYSDNRFIQATRGIVIPGTNFNVSSVHIQEDKKNQEHKALE